MPIVGKLEKLVDDLRANTSSEKNQGILDRMDKALDKLNGLLESFSLTPHVQESEKHEDAPPESPDINVQGAMKFVHVRKRGGRVVKRQVQEKVTE